MSLIKRGKFYSYDFIFQGVRKQGPTGQTDKKMARAVEAKIRTDLSMAQHGLAPLTVAPIFREFLETTFSEHCSRHAKVKATDEFYQSCIRRFVEWLPWRDRRLNEITADWIGKYCDHRLKTIRFTTVNAELSVLRKALLYAADDLKLIARVKVRLLPGDGGRTFVLARELEQEYLAAAPYPLKAATILTLDLGLRPLEVVCLKKADVVDGCVMVRQGKSKNAVRMLPLTARAAREIEMVTALWPDSAFLFPGKKIHGKGDRHLTRGALTDAHTNLRRAQGWPEEFKLYSGRHTFGTGLAESGATPYQIKSLMGHSSVTVSERYIHPQPEGLQLAMRRKEMLDQMTRGEEVPEVPANSTTDAAK